MPVVSPSQKWSDFAQYCEPKMVTLCCLVLFFALQCVQAIPTDVSVTRVISVVPMNHDAASFLGRESTRLLVIHKSEAVNIKWMPTPIRCNSFNFDSSLRSEGSSFPSAHRPKRQRY